MSEERGHKEDKEQAGEASVGPDPKTGQHAAVMRGAREQATSGAASAPAHACTLALVRARRAGSRSTSAEAQACYRE